jgi:hypothetical protein
MKGGKIMPTKKVPSAEKKSVPKKPAPKATKTEEKAPVTKMPTRSLLQVLHELDTLKANKKLLEAREAELKADLVVYLEAEGVKDTKGSFNIITEVDGKQKLAQKQARKTVKLNQERSEELFKKLGIWEEVTETKTVLNEDYIEQALLNGKLTQEQFENLCDINTTFAIVVMDYKPEAPAEEEMPEVKVSKAKK